jgi:ribosome-binding factor A
VARKRNPRVDKAVRAALAELLETEVADPRLTLVTLTDVEVTPDHEVATIYWSSLDPNLLAADPRRTGGDRLPETHEIEDALTSVTPRLRSMLGSRVRLRTTPELRFTQDPVVEQAARIEELLRRVDTSGPAATAGDDAATSASDPGTDAAASDRRGSGDGAADEDDRP